MGIPDCTRDGCCCEHVAQLTRQLEREFRQALATGRWDEFDRLRRSIDDHYVEEEKQHDTCPVER